MMGRANLRRMTAALTILAGAGAAALAGCGSQTKTVTVGSAPAPSTGSTQPAATTQTKAPGAQRLDHDRAEQAEHHAHRHRAGIHRTGKAHVRSGRLGRCGRGGRAAHGYTPNDTSQYHPDQTLRVLVATRTGSGDGYAQQAFFFIDGRYIGTDTKQPSATIRVASQSDTAVTLTYPLYRSNDPLCCPSAGQANVRYELNNGKLVPWARSRPSTPRAVFSRH